MASEGKTDITPYWRTLKSKGELNEKYPGGVKAQAVRLEAEGHTIDRRRKTPRVADFEKAREVILAITQQKELLDNNSVIQKIIAFRNPYTDVLNLLQVELLRRCRRTSETESELSRNALFLSINGIAAAMQSTG